MPNQYFPRGYFGYPYPQPNGFPPTGEAYPQYPFMSSGPQPMPGPAFMPAAGYPDPGAYMQRPQYDYPYPQYGFQPSSPYDPAQSMTPSWPQATPSPMGQMPPAYSSPMMQPVPYGRDYMHQPYMPQYPQMQQYDPQYEQYLEQARQYWADRGYPQQGLAYPPYPQAPDGDAYPQTSNYPQGFNERVSRDGENAPEKRRRGDDRLKSERKRVSKRDSESRDARARRREARNASQEKLEREAAKEAKLAQSKCRSAAEAARREALLQQELAKKAAARQREKSQISNDVDSKPSEAALNNLFDQKQGGDAAAAAAASIAAFHEAAKSVNEINLNDVTSALKPEHRASVENQTISADKDPAQTTPTETAVIAGAVGESSKAASADAPKQGKTSASHSEETVAEAKSADPDKTIAMPQADDLVVIPDNVKATDAKDASTAKTSEKTAVADKSEVAGEATSAEDGKSTKAVDAPTQKAEDGGTDNADNAKAAEGAKGSTEGEISQSKPPLSPLAIVGLVFGIVAIALAAFAPLLNFLGFGAIAVGAIALIVSAIAVATMGKGKKTGKPAAIAGIACGLIAIIIAIALHVILPANSSEGENSTPNSTVMGYVQTSSTATNASSSASANSAQGSQSTGGSSAAGAQGSNGATSTQGTSSTGTASGLAGGEMSSMDITPTTPHENLSVGSGVTYSNGLTVTVDKVESGLSTSSGTKIVCVTVTYKNGGSSPIDYNSFDWKVTDSDGTTRTYALYPSGENELNSGELTSGGSVTGNLYFEAPITTIIYEANYWNADGNATWKA